MKIGKVDIVPTAKATFKDFREDDLQSMAAEVAYHFLFAVVPLLIFLTALSGFMSRTIGARDAMASIEAWLFENLPASAAAALEEPIRNVVEQQAGGILSVGALLALWGGKNAMSALMKALNVAFDVEDSRPWWRKTLVSIALTIALGLAIVAASSFFLAGSFVGEGLANLFGLGNAWTTIWSFLRWPLIALLLVLALAFLYWAGPNVDAPFKWLTPGSVLAVVLWVVATFGLSIYFQNFAGYTETYGTLGGVLAFVFWIYVMSLILLLGGELNSVLALRHSPQARADAANPAKQGSDEAAKRAKATGKATGQSAFSAPSPDTYTPNPAIGAAFLGITRRLPAPLGTTRSLGPRVPWPRPARGCQHPGGGTPSTATAGRERQGLKRPEEGRRQGWGRQASMPIDARFPTQAIARGTRGEGR